MPWTLAWSCINNNIDHETPKKIIEWVRIYFDVDHSKVYFLLGVSNEDIFFLFLCSWQVAFVDLVILRSFWLGFGTCFWFCKSQPKGWNATTALFQRLFLLWYKTENSSPLVFTYYENRQHLKKLSTCYEDASLYIFPFFFTLWDLIYCMHLLFVWWHAHYVRMGHAPRSSTVECRAWATGAHYCYLFWPLCQATSKHDWLYMSVEWFLDQAGAIII